MLLLRCPDGTVAGYTCQRDAQSGRCHLVSPHCPSSHDNGTSTNTTYPPLTIHHGPYRNSPQPYNRTAHNTTTTTTTTTTALYTSQQPIFNCSRHQCGASIMPILRTCPDGTHAYPLCAWVTERQHCGYLDPSCSYPGWRSDPGSTNESAAVEELLYVGELDGGGGVDSGMARQLCERGGCMLPMYVRMCPDGSTVRPHCVWSTVNGTELCLADQPLCPNEADAQQSHNSRAATSATNGAMMHGVSLAVACVTAVLGLLVA